MKRGDPGAPCHSGMRSGTGDSRRSDGWAGLFWEAFRQSKNAMALLDENRCHVDVNGAHLGLLGYQRGALIGRPASELVLGGPLLSASEWRAALRQKQFTGVVDLVCADATLVRVEFAGHPELVTGEEMVLVVALRTTRGSRALRGPDVTPEGGSLSPRELEVIRLIADGFSSPEIARELHVSHNTIRTHARNSMTKLGARSRAQLIAKSLGEGLLWGEMS